MLSNACLKCPGEGAEVSGRPSKLAQRDQNSLVDSSERSTNSSAPNRIRKETRPTPSSVNSSSGRSQALSVTTRTPGIFPPRGVCSGPSPVRILDRTAIALVTICYLGRGARGCS